MPPRINISPPLLNTASPWATTRDDLSRLYDLPSTGAVTTRTSLLASGFPQDPNLHQHAFISPSSSLNSYGYSPHPLEYYLDSISAVVTAAGPIANVKPFIISVTGTPHEVRLCVAKVSKWSMEADPPITAYVEINLSCPNILDKPPPAYSSAALREYLAEIQDLRSSSGVDVVPVGIKTPPYTYQNQFGELIAAIEDYPGVISFITATNTLGNSLFLEPIKPSNSSTSDNTTSTPKDDSALQMRSAISSEAGTGVGGLAGESIHPLSLGNVFTIRRMLDASARQEVQDIVVIGAGGVKDADGYRRMRAAGAVAVGVGTAFGRDGIDVFDRILNPGAAGGSPK
ncbi:dihydroorotate dehydrogenase [Orbilia brochopaga]|uniref:Dihydroorotate oxidase n=1 Tax=Orbilia brochopaga TaxID=3140254 RepID=A0AAV9UFN3_9PEZI